MTQTQRIKVAPSLELSTSEGAALRMQDVELVVDRGEGVEVRLCFTVAPAQWRRIDEHALLHLDPEDRGPVFAGGLAADQPVELEARLDPAAQGPLLEGTRDIYEIGARVRGGAQASPWMQAEAWWALYVKQQHGPLKTGFATRWS